jgi:hypothetical protein
MNRAKLKAYAPQARKDFIQAVTAKAAQYGLSSAKIEPMTEKGDVVLIAGKPFPKAVGDKRKRLEDRIKKNGFEYTMEAMAYTWFNRLVAVRYMELHGYLDHGYRVLSTTKHTNDTKGENDDGKLHSSFRVVRDFRGSEVPEILQQAQYVDLPGLDQKKVIALKLDGTKEEDLYRLLLTAQFNALSKAMPFLFEKIDDETELLLPDNLLNSDSLIRKLVTEIDEEDWKEVEIIGWLYQFYISDKKDEVIGKVVKSEDIPAATQLFTPNWIVKYLVQNTIGRQWLATYPQSSLRSKMEYYIEPAEQTPEVQEQLRAITPTSLNPEELTLLDPACGSGHILVEAYDLFKAIYEERGYRSKDIPALILQKNLFGLEIDDRAAQLAAFALMMKARADDKNLFSPRPASGRGVGGEGFVQPNIISFVESKGLDAEEIHYALMSPLHSEKETAELPRADGFLFETENNLFTKNAEREVLTAHCLPPTAISLEDIAALIALFENAKTFGSLIQVPSKLAEKLPLIQKRLGDVLAHGDLTHGAARVLEPLLDQAVSLARQYDAVVANPPYMGSSFFASSLKDYINNAYSTGKSDLYACFVLRNLDFAKVNGLVGMITIPNWMFISRFEEFRLALLTSYTILSFVHNGRGVWGSDFGSCSFVIFNSPLQYYRGAYKRLFDRPGSVASSEELNARYFQFPNYIAASKDFEKVPGSPIVYWASDAIRDVFGRMQNVGDFVETREGLATADNDRFLRYWHEVNIANVHFDCRSNEEAVRDQKKWFCYVKGGPYRKWYGNNELIVNWQHDGKEVRANIDTDTGRVRSHNYNGEFAFREGCSWSGVSISALSVRYVPNGFMFDAKGPMAFTTNQDTLFYIIALLNSEFGRHMMSILAPTVDFKLGHIMNVPARPGDSVARKISENCRKCIQISQIDWDEAETSWGFRNSPLIADVATDQSLRYSFDAWRNRCNERIETLALIEEDNNNLLISGFDLQGHLSLAVDRNEVSLSRHDTSQVVTKLFSYAIGCVMGRYSLDKPGLIYAHGGNEGFDPSQYKTFRADDDGIIPLLDSDWGIRDDAANRIFEFVSVAWPKEHLDENLKFIADSLTPSNGEQPKDTIRRYLATGFYKHHLSMYKKRPIYWLFSSGKQRAFQCLVYLHRYNDGTLARMRTEYVIPLMGKMTARLEHLQGPPEQKGTGGEIAATSAVTVKRKLEKERDNIKKQLAELQAFDEKLRHYADLRIKLDLDDGVKVNYGKFSDPEVGDILAEVKAICGTKDED